MIGDPLRDALVKALISSPRVRVFNMVGTSALVPEYGSDWLGFYRSETFDFDIMCGVDGCKNFAEVGAHVMTLRENDYRSYITRMCKSCNGRNGLMDMKFDAGLAVAREKWRRG